MFAADQLECMFCKHADVRVCIHVCKCVHSCLSIAVLYCWHYHGTFEALVLSYLEMVGSPAASNTSNSLFISCDLRIRSRPRASLISTDI